MLLFPLFSLNLWLELPHSTLLVLVCFFQYFLLHVSVTGDVIELTI